MPIPIEILPSFLFYCYISAITPGPANLCSLSVALQRGKKDALQQWTGIFTGFFVVAMISVFVSYFVGAAAGDYVGYLSFMGAAYLVWLSVHMLRENFAGTENAAVAENDASSASSADTAMANKSFFKNFLTGTFVQLTNVKIMLMCLTALTSYVLPYNRSFGALFAVGLFLPFTGPIANLVWLFAGLSLQQFFARCKRAVTVVMAASLLLCAANLLYPQLRSLLGA